MSVIGWRSLLGLQHMDSARIDGGRDSRHDSVRVLVAGVSSVAALIHVEAAVDHYSEYRLYSAVFVALAVWQALWAWRLLRGGTRLTLLAGVLGNTAIALLWLASRTTGVPIAPVPWEPEPVGAADLLATLSELVIVTAATCLLLAGRSRRADSIVARLAPLILVVLAVSVLYGLGSGHTG
jgi:hypothetical protein